MEAVLARAEASGRETVGERIRRLRRERGLSQREISGPGVTHAHISRIESGSRVPSVKAIRVIARQLGISPEYLETGSDIAPRERLELRLADADLRLRLEGASLAIGEELTEIIREADELGEAELLAEAHVALGLDAARAGRVSDAIEYLSAAVTSGHTTPVTHASVYLTLGESLAQAGRTDDAVDLFESVLGNLAEDDTAEAVRVRFATHLSAALSERGELERARRVLDELADIRQVSETPSKVRLLWSRARIDAMEGRPRQALREMRRAIALLEETEDTLQLARAHLLCAQIYLWEGEAVLAERHLKPAEHLVVLQADRRDVAALQARRALAAAWRSDFDAARSLADAALEMLEENEGDQAVAWFALGLVESAGDRPELAVDQFERAVRQLESIGMAREAALVLRHLARALEKSGRAPDAAVVRERAAAAARKPSRALGRST
ncbi:MAG: helix-turn-helix domain-containing protein [Gaiellaceae bacterium]